jgi:drug/metabolite transporter (DMT)-like permease
VGILFFKERWRNVYLFALLCSIGGVWFIVRPDLGFFGPGELLGITGAFFTAWVINIIRYLRKTDEVLSIIFYLTLCTTLFTIIPAGSHELAMSISELLGLFLIGLFTTIAQLLMTAGYTYCSATGGGIISLLGLPLSLLLSKIFLDERLDLFLGGGALLIFISGYLIAFSKRKPIH